MRPSRGFQKTVFVIALGTILLLAAYLRFAVVTQSLVWGPYRADAAQYYNYAYNLRKYGTYSDEQETVTGHATDPKPDAFRTPGYPLFLAIFASQPPNSRTFLAIELWQALLGTVTVLIIFLIFRPIVPPWLALCAALLTAISPHLVNTTIYILSETLFTLLIAAAIYVMGLHFKNNRWFLSSMLVSGLIVGLAALTRPVLEYFLPCVVLLLFISYSRRQAWKGCAVLVLGFLLAWGPWVVRNYVSVGKMENNQLMLGTLHQGMYPGLMYHNDPRTRGYPYRFDPNYARTNKNLTTVTQEILHSFEKNPGQELAWYLIGKPIMLWSWGMIAGPGDVFIYPTLITPYSSSQVFRITHAFMYGLHWPLVIAAFLACILVWFPIAKHYFDTKQIFMLRAMSLLLFYNTGLLMIGAPYTRYSIPFLPILFGMAIAFSYFAYCYLGKLRKQSRESYSAKHRPGA